MNENSDNHATAGAEGASSTGENSPGGAGNDSASVRRFDSLVLDSSKARVDKWGFLHVDATVCKPGVYPYRQPNGAIRMELKPETEVFHADHIASVQDSAITAEHPTGGRAVTPGNAKDLTAGQAGTNVRRQGNNLVAKLKITDAGLIADINNRNRVEVSLGLDCRIDHTPGVWNNKKYDVVQRGMTTNHIAITRKARISGAALHLDSDDAEMVTDEDDNMTTMNIQLGNSTVTVESGGQIEGRLSGPAFDPEHEKQTRQSASQPEMPFHRFTYLSIMDIRAATPAGESPEQHALEPTLWVPETQQAAAFTAQ